MERKRRILYVGEFSGLSTGYATISKNLLAEFVKTGQYEVAELACYYKETDPYHASLAKQFPWKIYGNLPINDHEQQIYNSHPQNEFGRWKFDYVCLDFQPDCVLDVRDFWMCLSGNSPIQTISGVKNVQDIKEGDLVLTHKGRYRKVVKTFSRNHDGNFVTITTSNNGYKLTLTDNHPVLCIKRKNIHHFCPTNKNYKHLSNRSVPDLDIEPEWINSQDLETGDFVCAPLQTEFSDFEIDLDLARLIGYYAAEGCMMYNKKKKDNSLKGIQLSFNIEEVVYINDVLNIVNKKFGVQGSVKNNKNCAIIRFFSKEVAEFIIEMIPGLAGTKKFNEKLVTSNILIQQQILTGLLRGDGGYDDRRGYYCTKSRDLAYQVFQMCLNNNIMPAMGYNKNTLKEKTFYRYIFSFSGPSFYNFKQIYYGTYNFTYEQKIQNDYGWFYVKTIEQAIGNEQVYNFEIEEDNSYVSSITLHNCSFIDQSPFRKFFKTVFMPTVDAVSQGLEWIDLYCRTNHILTYTNFAYKVLADEGGGLIPLRGVATPAVDINIYKPVQNKCQHKEQFGLDPNSIIVGMVARNQRRKLFPDLMQAFGDFLSKAQFKNTNNVYLYLHTAHPDLGWDLPKYIKENGLSHKVLMTYFCHACKRWFPSFYNDALTLCKFCGQKSAPLSNSQIGIETDALAAVYNFMDLYVQFVTNEGLGIPCLEAASCGVPICGTYYSGVEDLLDNLEGKKISAKHWYEAETGRQLSYPSVDELVEYIDEFTSLPESIRLRMSRRTAELTRKYYGGWSNVAQKWMDVFDSIDLSPQNPWLSPIDIIPTGGLQPPDQNRVSDEQFIGWCLQEVLHRPDWVNSFTGLKMLRDLSWGRTVVNNLGFFAGEMSQLGAKPVWEACNREKVFQFVCGLREQYNNSEQMRNQYMLNNKILPW